MIRMSAEDALATSRANPDRLYPKPGRNAERLRPFVAPRLRPGFSFAPDARFFAAGSCFARNIESALRFAGAKVLSSPPDIACPAHYMPAMNLFHKYTVHSILNELRWAFAKDRPAAADLLVEARPGQYADLQLTSGLTAPLDEAAALRDRFNDTFRAAREADVIIVTLGLVECWFDAALGVYLNAAPTLKMTEAHPRRFEFHVLDHDEVLETLEELHALLLAHCPKKPKMLFTVSPVPLVATFRAEDTIVANCYSKSVQRAALDVFVRGREVDYFPSYEMVIYSDMAQAWADDDFRHPRQEIVDRIMASVLGAYGGESLAQGLLEARGKATAHVNTRDFAAAAEAIRPFAARYGYENDDLMMLYGRALVQTGERAEASRAFGAVAARGGAHGAKAAEMARFAASRADVEAEASPRDAALAALAALRARMGDDAALDTLEAFVAEAGEARAGAQRGERGERNAAEMAARGLIKAHRFAEAVAAAEAGLAKWPDSASLAWTRAQALRLTGAHRAALDGFLDLAARNIGVSLLASRNAVLTAGRMQDPALLAEVQARHRELFPDDSAAA